MINGTFNDQLIYYKLYSPYVERICLTGATALKVWDRSCQRYVIIQVISYHINWSGFKRDELLHV